MREPVFLYVCVQFRVLLIRSVCTCFCVHTVCLHVSWWACTHENNKLNSTDCLEDVHLVAVCKNKYVHKLNKLDGTYIWHVILCVAHDGTYHIHSHIKATCCRHFTLTTVAFHAIFTYGCFRTIRKMLKENYVSELKQKEWCSCFSAD